MLKHSVRRMMLNKITWVALFSSIFFTNPIVSAQSLEGKVVVITGASSGFGKGVAESMARQGAHLVLAARRKNLLDDLALKCGNGAIAVSTDVSDSTSITNLADRALKEFGHVDVWINDVGVGAIGKFEDIPIADHARVIDVNFKGVVFGSLAAIKIFKAQKYGTLINVGSIDGDMPIAYQSTYAATKAAVKSLDHTLAQELRLAKQDRIKVSTIIPYAVDTPWWDHAANYSGHRAQIGGMDEPNIVVKAIVRDSMHPKLDVYVGLKCKSVHAFHKFAPALSEKIVSNVSEKYVEKAPALTPTDGTLFSPMKEGTTVNGGIRERMKSD